MALAKFHSRIFTRQFASVAEKSGKDPAALWRNLYLFVGIPATLLGLLNCYLTEQEHGERPEFIPYEHLRIRHKRFPWGDGQRSLFHNPHTNPLPTGYEDE
ncbi:cytochrome c oxidase subunit 6A1, mitochondrial-like [Polistes fuscatus]|uniref:cytochrome c oxidase subunit 6A1, mitochondrial-like n=1 Tax=Polistes fuscatus TaxID=30207 RepID=UPI001CA8DF44|nr:cytochrome c oxidase subunit 6A1, mitochondrial-like [Polistes fuscatus]